MGGGSQGSGKSDYPGYVKLSHKWALVGTVDTETLESTAGTRPDPFSILGRILSLSDSTNPYTAAIQFDPDTDIASSQAEVDASETVIDAYISSITLPSLTHGGDHDDYKYELVNGIATRIAAIDTELNWESMLDQAREAGIDEALDWGTIYGAAAGAPGDLEGELDWSRLEKIVSERADENILGDAAISQRVGEISRESRSRASIARGALESGLSDLNATLSSAVSIGQAFIDSEHLRRVQDAETTLRVEAQRQKADFVTANVAQASRLLVERFQLVNQSAGIISNLMSLRVSELRQYLGSLNATEAENIRFLITKVFQSTSLANEVVSRAKSNQRQIEQLQFNAVGNIGALTNALASLQVEANRIKYVMKKEQLEGDIVYDVKDSLWDLELWQYYSNTLGALAGASTISPGSNQSSSASGLGGAFTGAASGAIVGTTINPGWGTAIGAVVGGVGGALAG